MIRNLPFRRRNAPVELASPQSGRSDEPKHYTHRTDREARTQTVHRLQIGLFGLGAVLLIVGLANVIMDRAQTIEPQDPIEEVIAADAPDAKPVVDPLADAGVAPATDPSPAADASGAPAKQGAH
ncbi:MAG: hypothetical protein KDE32_10885 [Novosphingobium sp.]|nr:hypothetical protein [Novosphingobium sp.]